MRRSCSTRSRASVALALAFTRLMTAARSWNSCSSCEC
jgi:hypothetical protein